MTSCSPFLKKSFTTIAALWGLFLPVACLRRPDPRGTVASPQGNTIVAPEGHRGAAGTVRTQHCDVIILGGSTAALAAALGAAAMAQGSKQVVCLTEPTEWLGGQLTSSGVSAIDFPHQKSLGNMSRSTENLPARFFKWMQKLGEEPGATITNSGNSLAQCWVSVRCYLPERLVTLINHDIETLTNSGRLQVLKGAVLTGVTTKGSTILAVEVLVRKRPWAWPLLPLIRQPLSQEISSWYQEKDKQFTYERVTLKNIHNPLRTVFIDASEWGELLALSRAHHVVGVEKDEQHPTDTQPGCGQSFTFPLALERARETVADPFALLPASLQPLVKPVQGTLPFSLSDNKTFTLDDVWRYRRLQVEDGGFLKGYKPEISSQNWTNGNDYGEKSLLLTGTALEKQMKNWQGGVDVSALAGAEGRAWAWMVFLRAQKESWASHIILSKTAGTAWGLSPLPYVRDTRRSVGWGGFMLTYDGPQGIARGRDFNAESIGLGAYSADIHAQRHPGCDMPPHVKERTLDPLPYTLPFQALTNESFSNLLVAGKTMAQTFLANASTRVHVTEYFSGTAAGISGILIQKDEEANVHSLLHNKGRKDAFLKKLQASMMNTSPTAPATSQPVTWHMTFTQGEGDALQTK